MRNPFGRPATLWHWWLGSLGWLLVTVPGWLFFSYALVATLDKTKPPQKESILIWGVLGSLGVAQVLVTWAAWRRPARYPASGRANWPALLMLLWRMGLAAFQLAWFGFTVIVLGYGLSGPAHSILTH